MKKKNLTAVLALFFGFLGVHRFYLGQVGRGVLYFISSFVGLGLILGFIDFIVFLSMDKETFDVKYNKPFVRTVYTNERPDYDRKRYNRVQVVEHAAPVVKKKTIFKKSNPFKKSGIEKFNDFDYQGAKVDFEKALKIDPKNVSILFNKACTHSLLEEKEEAFMYLDAAVSNGLEDWHRIKNHDALAYLRIQDEFENFERNGFRLTQKGKVENKKWFEQISSLATLKERGLISEQEFIFQKQKLLA